MPKRAALVRLLYYPDDMLVRREAEALRDLGFDVDVYCLRNAGEAAEAVVEGVTVHRLPLKREKRGAARNLFEYLAFFCLAAGALTAAHLRRPFAVIQVNTMPDFLVFATLLPRLLGARVTLQMYEPMPELWATKFTSPWPSRILRVIAGWAVRYADAVITVTESLKETLVAHGADPAKITVVLNTPDPRLFGAPPATSAASNGDGFRLICHGAIEERYGHDTMVQAVHALRDQLPGLQLIITGDGAYREEFLALVERLGLQERVRYLGYLSLAGLVQELARADAGIVAQKASPYSHLVHTGKMYDFLAFGKPVLASRLRAVQAYFDETSLAYFEPGDPADLARVILAVAGDPARRRELVANSQERYTRYRWECQKEAYASVYRRWL
mgnify:CR=1 FL=1